MDASPSFTHHRKLPPLRHRSAGLPLRHPQSSGRLFGWSMFCSVVGIATPVCFALIAAVWFTWGGIRDMKLFFQRLKEERVDALDNGMAVNHLNLNDPT